ncbi:MAG TPA: TIGR04282 family arsenosugar biosynthesis glycosyltransferase [Blastocatellia bacterium]|jgi:rSAM/selenodomain-associated transferase 1|nr:TIGR04282 family arsenosugar biosynthesis glycosyltransferase [Blastocatellia bacterium]
MRQALAVTAKAPRPGFVKTRLHGVLSVDDATELYRCFLKDTLALAESIPEIEVIISYTPEGSEGFFDGIISSGHRLLAQRGEGLGDKLICAFEDLFGEGFDSAALMNADSPTLPRGHIAQAFESLRRPGDRVVVGPAEDGGYYLIGVKRPHRRLFEQITWSSGRVLAETIERAGEIGLEVTLLPPWYDVDGVAEFERLKHEMIEARHKVPRSPARPPCALQDVSRDDEFSLTASNTRDFILSRWPDTGIAHTK